MTFWLHIFWSKNIRPTDIWPTLYFANDASMCAAKLSIMSRGIMTLGTVKLSIMGLTVALNKTMFNIMLC
jgi:hypothetical protein